ncbi:hypothetical protein [Sutcliffiella horikoshii]|uniref:hypothetical protein n=1 Tax=Sutcliffiella horikoshii TaxID=79883 RepID=UPI001CFCD38F|nr:hypothetical protein [Sutcliffiella horikoshii]
MEKINQENKRKIFLDDYRKNLMEKRQQEMMKEDIINEFNVKKGLGSTSPTSGATTEATRLLMEYIDRANMFTISKHNEASGKLLTYRKFFKSRRNQQVEVYFKCGSKSIYKEGKVSAIGRDFVMLTNLRDRNWIPYRVIKSANIPYGIPNYSNTHQHFIFDNNLRQKLLFQFGETVSRRDLLKQQFFEESLITNLETWKETWVVIFLDEGSRRVGKIKEIKDQLLKMEFLGKSMVIPVKEIQYIETIRALTVISEIWKSLSSTRRT